MPRFNPASPVQRVLSPRLWSDSKVMSLGSPKSSPLMLWLFLLTHPSSGRLPGVVVEPLPAIAGRLGWKLATTKSCLQELQNRNMVLSDDAGGVYWLPNAIRYNEPHSVDEIRAWAKEWKNIPAGALKEQMEQEFAQVLGSRRLFAQAFAKYCLDGVAPPADKVAAKVAAKGGVSEGSVAAEGESGEAGATPAKAGKRARKIFPEVEFEELWKIYPSRAGSNPKATALRAYKARRQTDKVDYEILKAGLLRYTAYCEATGKLNTETVLQAATFFGPSKRYEEAFAIPADLSREDDFKTSPDFERVFAAHPHQDRKAEAWAAWGRLKPDATLVDRMLVSLENWKKHIWHDPKFIPPLALWLQRHSWNRVFTNGDDFDSGPDLFEVGGAAGSNGRGNGAVYDGEVVREPDGHSSPAVPAGTRLAARMADPFDLEQRHR